MNYDQYLTINENNDPAGDTYGISAIDKKNLEDATDLRGRINFYLMNMYSRFLSFEEIGSVLEYLDYHYENYVIKNPGNENSFLYFVEESLSDSNIIERRHVIIREWIEEKKDELKESLNVTQATRNKITWKGTPSQFGYLFLELTKQGFIELPSHAGNGSYSGLAKRCFESFDIKTTVENLKKEMNPDKNSLSQGKRVKFTIPNISELA